MLNSLADDEDLEASRTGFGDSGFGGLPAVARARL